jgi:hypothetical protein
MGQNGSKSGQKWGREGREK